MLKASLTARYLVPTAPGLLLGLAMLAERCPRPRLAGAALAGAYLLAALPLDFAQRLHRPVVYGFETASASLMRRGVSRVVFAWDHEATPIIPRDTLERLGGVFFRRGGDRTPVTAVVAGPQDDLNHVIVEAARGERPGVIWIYNRLGHTAARRHPPAIAAIDPRWRCERVGDDTIGTLACWRAAPAGVASGGPLGDQQDRDAERQVAEPQQRPL
jgi:hypothetical protein